MADPQIRHRGTIGGALGARRPGRRRRRAGAGARGRVRHRRAGRVDPHGRRRTTSSRTSSRRPSARASCSPQIRVPKHTGWGAHYEKFVRVSHQWSIVGVAATVRSEGGTIAEARVGLTNMGSTPLRARAVEEALVGQPATDEAVRAAVASVADGTNPPSDLNGDSDYRKHLATVLTRRAVLAAAGA